MTDEPRVLCLEPAGRLQQGKPQLCDPRRRPIPHIQGKEHRYHDRSGGSRI